MNLKKEQFNERYVQIKYNKSEKNLIVNFFVTILKSL